MVNNKREGINKIQPQKIIMNRPDEFSDLKLTKPSESIEF